GTNGGGAPLFNAGHFPLPPALQRRLPSTFRDSRTCGSEPAILRSTFLARTTADTSDTQTRLCRNALSSSLSSLPPLLVLPRMAQEPARLQDPLCQNRERSPAS